VRVLVAGGAGFIGSHLCEALLARGDEVIALDDLSTGSRANVAAFADHPRFSLIEADAAEAPDVAVDLVMHLASPASPVHYDAWPLKTLAANSLGTWRLLDVARASGARFVFTSTSEAYGDPLVHPQPETYWGNVDPIGPRSQYDESKRFGEALVMSYRREHGVNASIARLFNTYGPRMGIDDGRIIPHLMAAAATGAPMVIHGDGSQTRSFCYVDDLVDGLLLLASDHGADGEVFNIGNTHEISIATLADRVRRLAGTGSEIVSDARRPGDPERRRPDLTKIRGRYGWEPRIGLDEGLARTLDWFREATVGHQQIDRAAVGHEFVLDVAGGVR
jgi:nucleoside-diphosphate-sugar epimerase